MINILPPTYTLFALLAMFFLHFFYPGAAVIPSPWNLVGLAPLVFGVWINLVADRSFRQAQTTVKPFEDPSTLLTEGVYSISRNPMYLGFVATLMGVAILLGTLTPYVVTIMFAFLLDLMFIRREEQNLEQRFGEEWLEYKYRVRRWI